MVMERGLESPSKIQDWSKNYHITHMRFIKALMKWMEYRVGFQAGKTDRQRYSESAFTQGFL